MKIAILSANLGAFDTPVDPVEQDIPSWIEEVKFHRITDVAFPPITGLTPRLQYRLPKIFGYDMFFGYDIYIWLDASMSLQHKESVRHLLGELSNFDMAFYKHPWRKTIQEEVEYIETKLKEGNKYIVSRYQNGLHSEFLRKVKEDTEYKDDRLYASNVFIYKSNKHAEAAMIFWWYLQSRYYSCDQVSLPYALGKSNVRVSTINEDVFHNDYVTLVSKHH